MAAQDAASNAAGEVAGTIGEAGGIWPQRRWIGS